MNKKELITFVNAMPDDTQFAIDEHWEKESNLFAQYVYIQSDYKIGAVEYIELDF